LRFTRGVDMDNSVMGNTRMFTLERFATFNAL
jgi:hypothetical protein